MTRDATGTASSPDFLSGGGEMGALMRAHDWSISPLGSPEGWPQSLRTAVSLMLNSLYPMFIAWGPKLAFLYNDGYRPIFGAKHPHTLGLPFREVWSEIWDDIAPLIERAMAGEATFHENLHLVMERNGFPEDTWYTFSYSPVRDESGGIGGMFCACQETTQQILSERALAGETERLRQMFDAVPGFVIFFTGPDHVIAYLNATHRERFGADDSWIGRPLREMMPGPAARGTIAAVWDKAYETGERFEATAAATRIRPPGGGPEEERFVDFVLVPVRDAAGAVTGLFCEGFDVTERVMAQREVERRTRELERVYLAAPVLIYISDRRERRTTYVNEAVERVLGYTPEEFYALPVGGAAGLIHPDDASIATGLRERAETLEDGEASEAEYRMRRKDGGYAWLLDRRVVLDRAADGSIERILGVTLDIGERVAAEAAIKDSAAQLQQLNATLEARVEIRTAERDRLWRNSQDMFVIVDMAGVVLSVSPAATPMLGWTLDDMAGQSILDFVHPDDLETSTAALAEARGSQIPNYEGRMRHKDGSWRWLSWAATPEGAAIYGTARDITEQKRTEEALRQSQKLESMGQLTGGVAHDFNNLLSPIIGGLDLLQRRGVGGEREQRLIDGALQSAERAKTLVQRLLAFARRQPLQPSAVDVGKLVSGMADLIASTSGPQIRVSVDAAVDLPAARADPNQLEMALLNLAVNARDAMPSGGALRISAVGEAVGRAHSSGLAPGSYVRLSVADTGTGMDEATRQKAIEPFFSTKGIGKGTGLGLSMVHGLASQLGGALTIDSRPGLGTNVELWLPATSDSVTGQEAQVSPTTVTGAGTALVVDDEPLVRASTADMLGELGYATLEVGSGEEALALIDGGTAIDLLVTDHLMPGLSGADLARALAAKLPGLPVLIVSGYAEADGIAPDLPRLTKPFRQPDLAASLAALSRKSG